MKLCRTITLTKNRTIRHGIRSMNKPPLSTAKLIAGPTELSFDAHHLAAFMETAGACHDDFIFVDDVFVSWRIIIGDQKDKKPLLSAMTGARALLLLGEIVPCLFEGFAQFDHELSTIEPRTDDEHLELNYKISAGISAHAALGNAVCLATMLDSLLFVRGLQIISCSLLVDNEAAFAKPLYLEHYRHFVAEIYGC